MSSQLTPPELYDLGIDSDFTDVGLFLGKLSVNGGVHQTYIVDTVEYAGVGDLTLTTAQVLGGGIAYDPNGASRSLVTPTGALLDASFSFKYTGTCVDFILGNSADAAELLTLTGGVGVTIYGDPYVYPGQAKLFRLLRAGADTWVVHDILANRPIQANHVNYDNIATAEATAGNCTISVDANLADGAGVVAAQPDVPRNLVVILTDANQSLTVGKTTIVGVDASGDPVTEVFNIENATGTTTKTITGSKTFATVASITHANYATITVGTDKVAVGQSTKLGLPMRTGATLHDVYKACVDGANEAVGTVGRTYGTIIPTTAPNNTRDYDFWYRYA